MFWLGYCNSMMNPIIYTCASREFKHAFLRILRCQQWCSVRHRDGANSNSRVRRPTVCSFTLTSTGRQAVLHLHRPSIGNDIIRSNGVTSAILDLRHKQQSVTSDSRQQRQQHSSAFGNLWMTSAGCGNTTSGSGLTPALRVGRHVTSCEDSPLVALRAFQRQSAVMTSSVTSSDTTQSPVNCVTRGTDVNDELV